MEKILEFDLLIFTFMDKLIAVCPWLNAIVPVITRGGEWVFWLIVGLVLLIPQKTRKIGIGMLCATFIRLPLNEALKDVICRPRPFALFNPEIARQCIEGYVDTKGEFVKGWMKPEYLQQVKDNMASFSPEFIQKWLAAYKYPYELGYHFSHGYSFPSGHTSAAFSGALGMLFMCKGKRQKIMGWCFTVFACLVGLSRIYLHVHYATDVFGGIVVGLACGLAGFAIGTLIYNKIVIPLEEKLKEKLTELGEKAEKKS